MKIGELARLTDISPKAIRRYETLGLVAPARTGNGYREFDDDAVRLVREIRTLNLLGIPVEETRPFLECLMAGSSFGDDCPSSMAEYRKAIDGLDAKIEALTARRELLSKRLHQAAYRHSSVPPAPVTDLTILPSNVPEPADDGAAQHLPGRAMPGLTLAATDDREVDLSALDPGRTVIYLYPLTGRPDTDLPTGWNDIPGARGCTVQACDFRDHHVELRAAGAAGVFGLSSQPTLYQREVAARLALPFPMLSDPELSLAAALSLPTFEIDGSRLYKRLTLIVRGGIVEHVFYPVFPPDRHAAQVLDWLADNPA
ncbi:MerR family transcriptional regulator [Nocardia sp. NBC_00511]|uniref:MerR family transcriptional regulator n=1 Tax=Nocardia sp. NBC_00511 TaxID=2903591 RepID=UPI0030E02B91